MTLFLNNDYAEVFLENNMQLRMRRQKRLLFAVHFPFFYIFFSF